MAATAYQLNQTTTNIGARRLLTVMERVMEEISFDAPAHSGETQRIDKAYVNERLESIRTDSDLSRFIL